MPAPHPTGRLSYLNVRRWVKTDVYVTMCYIMKQKRFLLKCQTKHAKSIEMDLFLHFLWTTNVDT